MNHYFVAYSFQDENKSGFGSIELSINDDIFVPSDIKEYLEKRFKQDMVIINWKPIETNQLSPALVKLINKEEE